MATGRVEQGTIKVGEEVEVLGLMQVCYLGHFRDFVQLIDTFAISFVKVIPLSGFSCS